MDIVPLKAVVLAVLALSIAALAFRFKSRLTAFRGQARQFFTDEEQSKELKFVAALSATSILLVSAVILFTLGRFIFETGGSTVDIVVGEASRGAIDSNHSGLFSGSAGASDCPQGYQLFSGYCSPNDYTNGNNHGRLEQVGMGEDGRYYCVWSGMPHLETFQASVRAVCLRIPHG